MKNTDHPIKERWMDFKQDVRNVWGKLTDNDLDKTKADVKEIGKLIQKKSNKNFQRLEKKLSDIFSDFDRKVSDDAKKGARL